VSIKPALMLLGMVATAAAMFWSDEKPILSGIRGVDGDHHLVAEGSAGDDRWSVVAVGDKTEVDSVMLRHRGVTVVTAEAGSNRRHTVRVVVLPGHAEPMMLGLLPAEAARAEVALDGVDDLGLRPRPGSMRVREHRPRAPVKLVRIGGGQAMVLEPAPANRRIDDGVWQHGDTVDLEVHDAQGRTLGSE